jgi:hypothetical protein
MLHIMHIPMAAAEVTQALIYPGEQYFPARVCATAQPGMVGA